MCYNMLQQNRLEFGQVPRACPLLVSAIMTEWLLWPWSLAGCLGISCLNMLKLTLMSHSEWDILRPHCRYLGSAEHFTPLSTCCSVKSSGETKVTGVSGVSRGLLTRVCTRSSMLPRGKPTGEPYKQWRRKCLTWSLSLLHWFVSDICIWTTCAAILESQMSECMCICF